MQLLRTIESLKENKETFDLHKTTFTSKLFWGNCIFKENSGGFLPKNELWFINAVKNHVLKNSTGVYCNRSKIKYIKLGKIKNSVWYSKDIYEIDLNAAYWNFAYKFNYIDKDLFLKGRKISKKTRLVALGNLAKKTSILKFDGEQYQYCDILTSEDTEGVFFSVSLETDKTMRMLETIADKKFLFYWVDAIVFQGKQTKINIQNYLNSKNIEFKIKKINKLIKKQNNCYIYDVKGERKFNFEKL